MTRGVTDQERQAIRECVTEWERSARPADWCEMRSPVNPFSSHRVCGAPIYNDEAGDFHCVRVGAAGAEFGEPVADSGAGVCVYKIVSCLYCGHFMHPACVRLS